MKGILIVVCILLMLCLTFSVMASDLALYTGPTNPDWISAASCRREADDIIKGVKSVFSSISDFGDKKEADLGAWAKAHTGDGKVDVLITACGTMPNSLYPFPNKQPDGSVVENFVDDGNVLINLADWIGYMSFEGGVRSADNGGTGAANIFDVPGLDFGSRNNNMKVNANGKKYLPSLKDFTDDRPWHVELLKNTDWEVTTFAEADANNADPAAAVNKKTKGIIAAMIQKAWPNPTAAEDNRGEVVVEFIKNWLPLKSALTSVEAKDKLGITWGRIKTY